ncbi:MAG: ADP-ribosylglycohydrolase family protein [Myxococcales bacterium]
MPSRTERVEGGLVGLLVGDALGVPYEFHAPAHLPPVEQIEMHPPTGFRRAHGGVPPGTWSDDGAQALCLLESLLVRGGLDLEDFGRRMLDWYERGHLAVDGKVFDVGVQTSSALLELRAGAPALKAGRTDERANGNGALMRVLPLALWHLGSDESLASDAMAQSRVTHGQMRSQACCALYCLWARRALDEVADPWSEALRVFRTLYPEGMEARTELDTNIVRPDAVGDAPTGRGSGYVVDCLRSAVECVESGDSYEQVVKAAIALGNDTDTTAAVAGGIAGLTYGVAGLPERWRAALRGQDLLRPLLKKLLQRVA